MLRKTHLGKLLSAAILIFVAATVVGEDVAWAATGTYYHATAQNNAERSARSASLGPGGHGTIQGWTWFSDPSLSYYLIGGGRNDTVFYFDDSNRIDAVYRGSVFTPGNGVGKNYQYDGKAVTGMRLECNQIPNYCKDDDGVRHYGVFSYMSAHTLNRGTVGSRQGFYDAHHSIRVVIDLTKVPGFNANSMNVQTLEVPIISALGIGGVQVGEHSWTSVTIRVQKKSGWEIKGESSTYKILSNGQTQRIGGNAQYNAGYTSSVPTILPGENSQFRTKLTNSRLGNLNSDTAKDVQVAIDMAYFGSKSSIINCARQNWYSCAGATDVRTPIVMGPDGSKVREKRKNLTCKQSYNGMNLEYPQSKVWDAAGADSDAGCMRWTVPSGGAKVGQYVCTKVSWYTKNSRDNEWDSTRPACFLVRSDFNLVPFVGAAGQTSIDMMPQGGSVSLTSTVQNTGNSAGTIRSDSSVYSFRIPASAAAFSSDGAATGVFNGIFNKSTSAIKYAEADYAAGGACAWLSAQLPGMADCANTASDSAHAYGNKESRNIDTSDLSSENAGVGDLVCRVAVVWRYNWDSRDSGSRNRVSYPRCYRISKRPMVQIWGNDVRVGSRTLANDSELYKSSIITGGANQINIAGQKRSVGSWGEYAMFAPEINTMGSNIVSSSAGGLSGIGAGAKLGAISAAERNRLTFANTNSANYGQWGNIGLQSVATASSFSVTSTIGSSNILLDGRGSGVYKVSNSSQIITLHGQVGDGAGIVIDATGKTVVIDENINYVSSNYSSAAGIPQLLVFANNIIIKDNVENVDAWLIARGTNGVISTCETGSVTAGTVVSVVARGQNYAAGLNSKICDKRLRINGPVSATALQLRRTFGADSDAGGDAGYTAPAEIINARADAYLWAQNYAGGSGALSTDKTTELPPRY